MFSKHTLFLVLLFWCLGALCSCDTDDGDEINKLYNPTWSCARPGCWADGHKDCGPCSNGGLAGYYCPGDGSKRRCPSNTHSCTTQSAGSCWVAGVKCNGGPGFPTMATCYACGAGQQVNQDQSDCEACQKPLYNPVPGGSCVPCPAGFYWVDAVTCIALLPQTYTANVSMNYVVSSVLNASSPDVYDEANDGGSNAFNGLFVANSTNVSILLQRSDAYVNSSSGLAFFSDSVMYVIGDRVDTYYAAGGTYTEGANSSDSFCMEDVPNLWVLIRQPITEISNISPDYVTSFGCSGARQFELGDGTVVCLMSKTSLLFVSMVMVLNATDIVPAPVNVPMLPAPVLGDGTLLDPVGMNCIGHYDVIVCNACDGCADDHYAPQVGIPFQLCVFVHGIGQWFASPPTPTFEGYWGNAHQFVQFDCGKTIFLHLSTITAGWDSYDSHKQFCSDAGANEHGVIQNTLIFSHSMGSLIIAAAIQRSVCSLDTTTTRWYTTQTPANGSIVATVAVATCVLLNSVKFLDLSPVNQAVYEGLVLLMNAEGVCLGHPPSLLPAPDLVSLQPTYKSPYGVMLPDLWPILNRYVGGALCGCSYRGPGSFKFHSIAKLVGLQQANDGVVEWDSCTAPFPNAPFMRDFYSPWYKLSGNHECGACRHGDFFKTRSSKNPNSKRPCSWFQNMAMRGLSETAR